MPKIILLILLSFNLFAHADDFLNNTIEKANNGDPYNLFRLGILYKYGYNQDITQDLHKHFEFIQKSAEKNYPPAISELAHIYSAGLVVKKDYEKAFLLYQKASTLGDLLATYQTGIYFYIGTENQKPDYEKSKQNLELFLNKSSNTHYLVPNAQYTLGLIYYKGHLGFTNYKIAKELFEKSANLGDYNAQTELGIMYSFGIGVKKIIKNQNTGMKKQHYKENQLLNLI